MPPGWQGGDGGGAGRCNGIQGRDGCKKIAIPSPEVTYPQSPAFPHSECGTDEGI